MAVQGSAEALARVRGTLLADNEVASLEWLYDVAFAHGKQARQEEINAALAKSLAELRDIAQGLQETVEREGL
jgi:hypothetical protein